MNDTESQNLDKIKEDFQALRVQLKNIGAQVIFSSILPVQGKGVARNRCIMHSNSWLRGWCHREGFGFYDNEAFFDDYNMLGRDGIHLSRRRKGSFSNRLANLNLLLTGDFNYPDICWKNNTAARMSSIKFLERVEDCFLLQMLGVPTRKEAQFLFTNQENLLCNISVSNNLGSSDHNIVEFGIWLSMLKVSTKTRVLDFRRANFSSLRAQLGGIPWDASMEDKGANECWEFFKNALLEAQKQFIPYKRKGSKQSKRSPWLNHELLGLLKTKREAYQRWRSGRLSVENYKGIARVCKDAVRKAKAQLELELARDVKNHKKRFFRYVNCKQKQKENIGPLLNSRGESVTNNAEKAEVLNTFFTSVFTNTVGSQALGTKIQFDRNTDPPSVKEELVCELLQELDPYKSMGPDAIHPKVLRELADVIAGPLSTIFKKSWRSGDVPEDWRKANVTPIYKKGSREDPVCDFPC
ncbi:uncharacterized protein LJ206_001286 [Theristicus caerulescens]